MTPGRRSWPALLAALVLLDASLTFRNVWPTPAITWRGDLSIEFGVCLLAFAAAGWWRGAPSRVALRSTAAVWLLFVLAHYVDVTAPALYGRDINLYWDIRFVPDVAAMLARAAPVPLVVLVLIGAAAVLIGMYAALRWALGRLGQAAAEPGTRRTIAIIGAIVVALFVAQRTAAPSAAIPAFASPVTLTYARQARFVVTAMRHSTALAASPSLESDFSQVQDADVLLFFIESYGAVTYDNPEFARRLAGDRAALDAAVRDTGRAAVSAYVESPTFGGSSWFAHLTLLSGIEVRDPDTNALLMTQKRDTLVTAFSRHAYRTVALMPGIWHEWPEGAFYGFDDIYGGERLAYTGPDFGWWSIPDQFALARLDALELNRASRRPLFVVFPTISTHTPFSPTPPYQPDWTRMLGPTPYDESAVGHAYDQEADWMNLAPSYMNAMSYAYTTLAGYLRERHGRDFVMILIGDHQPPAFVSGEGAPWDVPVHVIASRKPVLDRLLAHGFHAGLTPARPALGHMQALVPMLLDAFGQTKAHRGYMPPSSADGP